MTFGEAFKLLKEGKRIISKRDKEVYDQQWLSLNEEGLIEYMNEPWEPTPELLLEYMHDEWIILE